MNAATPYKGLVSYEYDDRDNFFGREEETEVLLGKILAHKVTLLYAAPGVGKSSLLGAAVIPELEDPAHDNLDVAYHRIWTTDPLAAIQETVSQTLVRRKKLAAADVHELATPALPAFLARCQAYSSDPLVLVLDQFEELFRYHAGRPSLASCVEQLAQVMTDRTLPVAVVLSMREDFLAELSVFRGRVPDLFSNHYRLQPLSIEQARAAIVLPVEQPAFGFRYEPELVEALIHDLAERDKARQELRRPDLPLLPTAIDGPYLQIVCRELWEREQYSPDKTFHKKTYDILGGAQAIIGRYFNQVMQGCSPAQRRLASRAFSFLVTEGGAKMAYPERQLARILKVRLDKLHPVLQKLNTARVLRDDHRPEGTWYELYHDVFAEIIDTWNRNFQAARRRLGRIVVGLCLLALLIPLAIFGYRQYQIAQSLGTLEVQNPEGAALSLTCVRHYGENARCQEDVQSLGTSVSLAGPADYLLTAQHGTSWTMRYPVYIHGYGHRVAVRVRPPPASVPDSMAYIPGGVFRMGDKDDRDGMGQGDEQPHHDASVDGFFMDRYEVTNGQYQQCVDAGACESPHYDDNTCYHPVQQGDKWDWTQGQVDPAFQEASKPVVCVDWEQARAYCKFVHKRLPTEAEWEKAATGPAGYKWSFGNDFDGTRLNYCDKQCDFRWKDEKADDGYRWTAPVGHYPEEGYGLYDMSGNVWEWVEDWYDEQFYSTDKAKEPNPVNTTEGREGRRGVRGGGWGNTAEDSRVAGRGRGTPAYRSSLRGFRCALSAQGS